MHNCLLAGQTRMYSEKKHLPEQMKDMHMKELVQNLSILVWIKLFSTTFHIGTNRKVNLKIKRSDMSYVDCKTKILELTTRELEAAAYQTATYCSMETCLSTNIYEGTYIQWPQNEKDPKFRRLQEILRSYQLVWACANVVASRSNDTSCSFLRMY